MSTTHASLRGRRGGLALYGGMMLTVRDGHRGFCALGLVMLVAAMSGACTSVSGTVPSGPVRATAAETPRTQRSTAGPSYARLARGERCPVTPAADRKQAPPAELLQVPDISAGSMYGDGVLWAGLPEGTVFADREPGGLYFVKIGWWRGADGTVRASVRSMNSGEKRPGTVPGGYGSRGSQPVGFSLHSAGCWYVSGTLNKTAISFVMQVQ